MNKNKNIEEIDISRLMNSDITHMTIPTPVDTIISRLESGFYYIPDYQRRFVWDDKQIVALMISLMKDIPIPKLYMYNNEKDKKYTIIDGQQRLTSLFFFVKGVYPSSKENRVGKYNFKEISELIENYKKENDKYLKKEIKDKLLEKHGLTMKKYKYIDANENEIELDYERFNSGDKLIFDNKTFEFGAVFVKDGVDSLKKDQVYTDIFRLLNSAGSPLSSQEIRNGIYYDSQLYKEIIKFNNKSESWNKLKKITFKNDREIRYENIEFLLRLLALDEYVEIKSSKDLVELILNYDLKFDLLKTDIIKLEKYNTYSDLIDNFSLLYKDKNIDDKLEKLELFFKSINFDDNCEGQIKLLNIEAYFLACCKLDYLNTNYLLACKALKRDLYSTSKTSSKKEILKRIIQAAKNLITEGEENFEK